MNENIKNRTLHGDFHLLAFSSYEEVRFLLFTGVLLMYVLTVLANVTIFVLVCLESHMHTPMYFFLCNLSVQDILYVSATQTKLMAITITGNTSISFPACFSQMFLFTVCLTTEFLLLTSMAYDRYVAICIPLHYSLIMRKNVCALLSAVSWSFGALNSLMYTLLLSNLSFCNSQEINHFICELKSILILACNDIKGIMNLIFLEGVLLGLITFVLIVISYMYIISSILKINTSAGRLKAFSSCSSHLTIVVLFCGTSLGIYIKPVSEHSEEQEKLLSLLYVAVVPMLNPLVYSLRNNDVQKAMKKYLKYK
ncbi:olfactory receptor 1G1-like [Rhinophrynus dorsalis]